MDIPRHLLEPLLSSLFSAANKKNACRIISKKNSIIAGGCIRDFLLRRPISDIDIYAQPPLSFDPSYRNLYIGALGKELLRTKGVSSVTTSTIYSDEDNDDDILGVLEFKYHGYDVDLVIVNKEPTKYVLENFDTNISKVYFNPMTDTIVRTPEFRLAVKTQNIIVKETFVSAERLEKLAKKFPEFSWSKV